MKRKFFPVLFVLVIFACENHRFDADRRQIMAKDEIENKLHKVSGFDVSSFREDTIKVENDSNFKKLIRYTLDIQFIDSNKVLQKKKGIVMFTPNGQSIINSKITDL